MLLILTDEELDELVHRATVVCTTETGEEIVVTTEESVE